MSSNAKAPSAVDVHVGARIRELRIIKGITQEMLAAQVGVTFQQVQKYEKGTNRVGAGRLQQIATALGVPITEFFGAVDGSAGEARGSLIKDRLTVDLVSSFDSIGDPEIRRAIVGIVTALAAGSVEKR